MCASKALVSVVIVLVLCSAVLVSGGNTSGGIAPMCENTSYKGDFPRCMDRSTYISLRRNGVSMGGSTGGLKTTYTAPQRRSAERDDEGMKVEPIEPKSVKLFLKCSDDSSSRRPRPHILQESIADNIYHTVASNDARNDLCLFVPELHLYYPPSEWTKKVTPKYLFLPSTTKNNICKLSRWNEQEQVACSIEQRHQAFAVDALLGNYDVFGLVNDNFFCTRNPDPSNKCGEVIGWRIDNGGALLMSGTGGSKNYKNKPIFTDVPHEIFTYSAGLKIQIPGFLVGTTGSNFRGISWTDIVKQMKLLVGMRRDIVGDDETAGACVFDEEVTEALGQGLDNWTKEENQAMRGRNGESICTLLGKRLDYMALIVREDEAYVRKGIDDESERRRLLMKMTMSSDSGIELCRYLGSMSHYSAEGSLFEHVCASVGISEGSGLLKNLFGWLGGK